MNLLSLRRNNIALQQDLVFLYQEIQFALEPLQALRVPVIDILTSSSCASLATSPTRAATLAIERNASATSRAGSSRSSD